ncbi:MAG: COG4315 family predicted lipoprotein [Chloroflexota bacterium]
MTIRVPRRAAWAIPALFLAILLSPAVRADSALVQTASNPTLGSILVNAQGMTLYHLSVENGTQISCTGGCAGVWPPLFLAMGATAPTAGAGVTGMLATINRPDGLGHQVTYNGAPLYTFSHDSKPGDTNGEGIKAFGGVWHAVTANSVPLAATRLMHLSIKITTTGSTVWGTVRSKYTWKGKHVTKTCSAASCSLKVPHGVKVHFSQTATNSSTWPFKDWEIAAGRHHSTIGKASTSMKIKHNSTVTAVYVLNSGGGY